MKTRIQLSTLVLFGLIVAAPAALAAPRFSIVGVGNYSRPSSTTLSNTYKAKLGYGGGLLAEFRLGAKVGLELGALYNQRKFDDTLNSTTNTTTLTVVEAPLALRWWLHPAYSLFGGGYYAGGLGKVKKGSSTITYSDAEMKAGDYGVLAGFGFNFRLGKSASLLIDGRYTLGMANISSVSGQNMKYVAMQGLVGLRFGGGK